MASSLTSALVSEATSKIPGASTLTAIASAYHQDNVLVRARDRLLSFINSNKDAFGDPGEFLIKWKMRHSDIPDRKFGAANVYDPEFERLYEFIIDVGNKYSTALGDEIRAKIPKYLASGLDTVGTENIMKEFIAKYPKGYKQTSTVPTIALGESNPLSLINKETTPASGSTTSSTSSTTSTTGGGSTETKEASTLGNFSMTTMIIIILAIIVAFFLFR